MKDVSGSLAINPNTVLKAYRELGYEGLASARPGVAFVTKTLTDASIAAHRQVSQDLLRWYRKARAAGLDSESIDGIYQQTVLVRSWRKQYDRCD